MPSALPEHGRPWPEIERTLLECRLHDPPPVEGAPEVYWPNVPDPAFHAAREAQAIYAHFNAFLVYCSPGYARIDQELRTAVRSAWCAGRGHVTLTAGGTEGNFLAVKAAREWRRAHRPTTRPNMVLPITAHPSFDKAGHELGVEVRRVATTAEWEADPAAMDDAIDDATVLIVGSVPSYGHGTIDIPALAELAAARDVWMHVDGAVGGFLAPHMREIDPSIPPSDLRVPGVRSMTADLHKYGFCLNGISTFTIAQAEDLHWPRSRWGRSGRSVATPETAFWAVGPGAWWRPPGPRSRRLAEMATARSLPKSPSSSATWQTGWRPCRG